MFKSFWLWLNKPYYFNPSINFKFKLSFIFGFSVFVFLFLFEPFGLSNFKESLLIYSLSIGFITFLGKFITLTVPPILFKNYFNEDSWNVKKNILFIFFGVLFIGSALWYFGVFFKKSLGVEHVNYFKFLYYSFLVGAIPILSGIYINEKTLRQKRLFRANEINAKKNRLLKNNNHNREEIILKSNNKNNTIKIIVDKLIYVTSEGNYTSFFIENKEKVEEKILRITLNSSFEQLKKFKNIIRCHKSYIVNTNYVNKVSGNARGYLLHSDYIPFLIPVSRKFSKSSILSLLE